MPVIRRDKEPTEYQKQIIYAMLLGDASTSKPPKGINYHLSVYHSQKQIEYLRWKQDLLKPFSSPIQYCAYQDKRFSKAYPGGRFHTITHPFFTKMREMFYEGGHKVIRLATLEQLTEPICLALLVGDDGSFNGGQVNIAVCQFTPSEAKFISDWIFNTYKIDSKIVGTPEHPRLNIMREQLPFLRNLLLPVIPEYLLYKIGGKDWVDKRGKVTRYCLQCSSSFQCFRSDSKKYCSPDCFHKSRIGISRPEFAEKMVEIWRRRQGRNPYY